MRKLKNFKPIIIIPGDPESIFYEIFIKSLKKIKIISPIIFIGSKKKLIESMKKFKLKKNINNLSTDKFFDFSNFDEILIKKTINVIDVNINHNNISKISKKKINDYIEKCFEISIKILKSGYTHKFINGPISKSFLKKKFLGITEYFSSKFKIQNFAMLIYNKNLAVCPLTTHLPLKMVTKKITKKNIFNKIKLIDNFYRKNFKLKPKIAVTGLNPHCESIDHFNEDLKIISPLIKNLKKKHKIYGPIPADTIFTKSNRTKYNVILGMYHDQVLAPLKSLYEFDAINITLGLPVVRITPDHGPNKKFIGKNKSNPISLIRSLQFLDN